MAGAKSDGSPTNGALSTAPSAESAVVVGSTADLLLRGPAAEAYSEEQKRACLACALRLREPKLGDILEQLYLLTAAAAAAVAPGSGACNAAASRKGGDTALKALAALLGSRAPHDDAEAVSEKLARERGWLRSHRLFALSILLQAPSLEVDELLRLALRASPHGLAVNALCVLADAEPIGATLGDAQQAVALRLGRGRLPAVVQGAGLRILGAVLRCEPAEGKVVSLLENVAWTAAARDSAKRVATSNGRVGDANLDGLEASAVVALRREPREKQLRGVAGLLNGSVSRASRREASEASIIETLATSASDLPGETVSAVLHAVFAPGELPVGVGDGPLAHPERAVDSLVQRIGTSGGILDTAELRLQALASLFQTAARQEVVLARVARYRTSGSLAPLTCRSAVEFLLLGKLVTSAEKGRVAGASSTGALLGSLQRSDRITAEALRLIAEALPGGEGDVIVGEQALASARPKASPKAGPDHQPLPVDAKLGSKSAPPTPSPGKRDVSSSPPAYDGTAPQSAYLAAHNGDEVANRPAGGRFGLGALELLPLDDDEDEADEESSVGSLEGGGDGYGLPPPDKEESGWDALRALVADDEDDEEGEEEEEEEEEEDEEEKASDDASDEASEEEEASDASKPADAAENSAASGEGRKKPRAEAADDEEDESGEGEDEESEADDEEEDEDDDAEEGVASDEDEGAEEDESISGSDIEESYHGSDLELDPLGLAQEGSEEESDKSDAADDDKGAFDLSAGLLTSMFSGGSLHAEEERGARDRMLRARAKPASIRVVFPSLIWRGKDMMVLNKPADWICSASDVDKKKGRPLDPNEKVENKGYKTLDDLLGYKFVDREKKYIHWWIQLMHDLDEESYPNLFDEDQNYGLCHRLDRETSGTVLVGLTQLARQQMRECFHRHYVRKLYVCLAHGMVEPREQTIDRNIEALGQQARLHPSGKRARTHVTVLGYYTRKLKNGKTEEYSLCTCEIAEGRMHQIRLHMSGAIGAPIVSEFYYQTQRKMIEDRRWCARTFLHAYAVGFPDVSGSSRRVGVPGTEEDESGLVEDEKRDTEQEWHCCICPLTPELREALKDLEPADDEASDLLKVMVETGLMKQQHQAIHCMGTAARKDEIDDKFFPWSSVVNPIEIGDLNRPREGNPGQIRDARDKGKSRGKGRDGDNPAALRPKAKPRRRVADVPRRRDRDLSASPRPRRGGPHGPRRRRCLRRSRSPMEDSPNLSRSDSLILPPPRRRARSRSGRIGRRPPLSGLGGGRRRIQGGPSPYRSMSGRPRRKRRHIPSRGASMSPAPDEGPDVGVIRRRGRRRGGKVGLGIGTGGGGTGGGSAGSNESDDADDP